MLNLMLIILKSRHMYVYSELFLDSKVWIYSKFILIFLKILF